MPLQEIDHIHNEEETPMTSHQNIKEHVNNVRNHTMACMDGRVSNEGKIGFAGSGVLLERDPATNLPIAKYMDKFVEMVKSGQVTEITWHPGCGAAELCLKRNGNSNPSSSEVDTEARLFAERLAKALQEMTGVIMPLPRMISVNDLHHEERGVYVDTTNRFHLHMDRKKLPNGFVLSPLPMDDLEYMLEQAEVAILIAFKGHGLGESAFSDKQPFFISVIREAKDKNVLLGFETAIENRVKKEFPEYRDKIKVNTINV